MKPAVRLAVAGAGLIGRAHLKAIARAASDCELVAIVDPSPAAVEVAAQYGVPLFTGLSTMLDTMGPDGVILATPNTLHVPGAMTCLQHGVPALIEKPVADELDEAVRLARAVEASGLPFLVGHHRRHSPLLQAARAAVSSGRLGRLVTISGSATFRKPDHYFAEGPWRCQSGPLLINMVHEVDCLRLLAGEIVEVQALASHAIRGHEAEDTVAISLRFESGALGSFMLSDAAASPRSWEQTSGENPSYDHHPGDDCYVLAGERGQLSVPTMRVTDYAGEASWWAQARVRTLDLAEPGASAHARDPIARQLAHFCAVLRGEARPLVSVADATRTLAVTLAIRDAAASGDRISLH